MSDQQAATALCGQETTFFVDNEPVTTENRTLTVLEILRLSQNVPVEDFFLVEFHGQCSPQGCHQDLNEVIQIQPQQRFAAVFRGATPVS